jgi:hypothetical protein
MTFALLTSQLEFRSRDTHTRGRQNGHRNNNASRTTRPRPRIRASSSSAHRTFSRLAPCSVWDVAVSVTWASISAPIRPSSTPGAERVPSRRRAGLGGTSFLASVRKAKTGNLSADAIGVVLTPPDCQHPASASELKTHNSRRAGTKAAVNVPHQATAAQPQLFLAIQAPRARVRLAAEGALGAGEDKAWGGRFLVFLVLYFGPLELRFSGSFCTAAGPSGSMFPPPNVFV